MLTFQIQFPAPELQRRQFLPGLSHPAAQGFQALLLSLDIPGTSFELIPPPIEADLLLLPPLKEHLQFRLQPLPFGHQSFLFLLPLALPGVDQYQPSLQLLAKFFQANQAVAIPLFPFPQAGNRHLQGGHPLPHGFRIPP